MRTKNLLKIGVLSIWVFATLEIVLDFWFASRYPGYSQISQSISRLGQVGSPILGWVQLWGIFFTLLIFLFGLAFYVKYKCERWTLSAFFSLITYGLGEGLGSSFLPLDLSGAPISLIGHLHNFLSGLGDLGLVVFALLLLRIFPIQIHFRFNMYVRVVLTLGFCLILIFLSITILMENGLLSDYKGIWQRGYIYNFHLLLVVLGFKMLE